MSPTLLLCLRALHVFSVIIWVGGLSGAAMVVVLGPVRDRHALAGAVRRVMRFAVNPAMVVAWLSALTLLLDGWTTLYARAGWMHGKLTLALLLSGVTGIVGGGLRRAASEAASPSTRPLSFLTGITLVMAAMIVLLVTFRFGG